MSNYSPLEVTFIKGDGCWLTDSAGDKYLDALSGIGVVNLGHCHPTITKKLVDQSQKLLHTSNVYRIENQEILAKSLCNLANMDKVFFSNSGAEANEAAIKIARLYARSKDIENPIIPAPLAVKRFRSFTLDFESIINIGNRLFPRTVETIFVKTFVCKNAFSLSR